MTTSISERANAYRSALRDALNDGLSIQAATDAAKKAARDVGNNFPEPPSVELTDAELRLIPECELTASECDRLQELETLDNLEAQVALDATLPKGKSGVIAELAAALGYQVVNVEMPSRCLNDAKEQPLIRQQISDDAKEEGFCCANCGTPHAIHGDECGQDDEAAEFAQAIRDHEAMEERCGVLLQAPEHIQLTIDARRKAKDEGNCEDGYDQYEPDLKGCPSPLADAWRDAVGVVTPAGLRMTAKANFMTNLCNEIDTMKEAQCDEPKVKDYVDYGEDLSHEEKVEAGMPETKTRDCDVPATLRAVEIHSTENYGTIREWFDGDGEMHQFLCALKLSLYAEPGGLIKDQDGEIRGMWFYAHFGPTPVS